MEMTFSFGRDFVAGLRNHLNLTQAEIDAAGGPSEAMQNDVEVGRKSPKDEAAAKYRLAFDTLRPDPIESYEFTAGQLFSAAWHAMQAPDPQPFQLDLDSAGEAFSLHGFDHGGIEYGSARPLRATQLAIGHLPFSPWIAPAVTADYVIGQAVRSANVEFRLGGGLPGMGVADGRRVLQTGRPDLHRSGVPAVVIDPLWQIRTLDEARRVLAYRRSELPSHTSSWPAWSSICLLAASRAAWTAAKETDRGRAALTVGGDSPSPLQYLQASTERVDLTAAIAELASDRKIFLTGPDGASAGAAVAYLSEAFDGFQRVFLSSLVARQGEVLTLSENAVRSVEGLLPHAGAQALVITQPGSTTGSTSAIHAVLLGAAIRAAFAQVHETVSVVVTDWSLAEARVVPSISTLEPMSASFNEEEQAMVVFTSNELTIIALGGALCAQRHRPFVGG